MNSQAYNSAEQESLLAQVLALSPAADNDLKSLLPSLLSELHWQGSVQQLFDFIPDSPEPMSLDEFRDVLHRSGYQSQVKKSDLSQLADGDFPTLIKFKSGEHRLALERTTDGITVSDGQQKQQHSGEFDQVSWLELSPLTVPNYRSKPWFKELMKAFSGSLLSIFILSFFIALGSMALPLFTMSVYDFLIPSGSLNGVVAVGSGALIAIAGLAVGLYFRAKLLSYLAANINFQAGRALFQQLLMSPGDVLLRSSSFQNQSRIRDVERAREFFGGVMAAGMFDLPFIVIGLTAIAILAGWLVVVPFLGTVVYLVLAWHFSHRMEAASTSSAVAGQRRQQRLRQAIEGLQELRNAGAGLPWLKQFQQENVRAARSNFNYTMTAALQQTVGRLLNMLIALATMLVGVTMVMNGAMSAGGLIATMMLIWRVTAPLQTGFFALSRFGQLQKSIQQMNGVMAMPQEPGRDGQVTTIPDLSAETLEIDRLVIRYSGDRDVAVSGVALTVKIGQVMALVGPNGCGKSTLLSAAAGLLQPQVGSVRLAGQDIRQFNGGDYRRHVAYVGHKPVLLPGSVRDNVSSQAPAVTDQEIWQALALTGIDQFIKAGSGLDTPVLHEGKILLPESVCEALCLSRALLCKPTFLLLDDILPCGNTSTLDAYKRLLAGPPAGMSIIYATHSESLMTLADTAVIMDKGSVAQVADLKAVADSKESEIR